MCLRIITSRTFIQLDSKGGSVKTINCSSNEEPSLEPEPTTLSDLKPRLRLDYFKKITLNSNWRLSIKLMHTKVVILELIIILNEFGMVKVGFRLG